MSATRFWGAMMMAVGGMMALMCGSCTLVFLVQFLVGLSGAGRVAPGAALFAVGLPLVVGGLPTAGAAALFMLGRTQWRRGGAP